MTENNKPGLKAATDDQPQSPEDIFALKVALREAEKRAADEKRRADEAEARYKNNPAAKTKPEAGAPQPSAPGTPGKPLNLNHNFKVFGALRWAIMGGAAGLAFYTGREFRAPAISLFMAGPRHVYGKMGGFKGTVSAIALASAQLLGIGGAGYAAYDYGMEKTAFESSNATMTARGGVVGFLANQFIRSSASIHNGTNTQSFFDMMTNSTLNGVGELTTVATEGLAKFDTAQQTSLSSRFVQICSPVVTHAPGQFSAQVEADRSLIQRHYAGIDNRLNEMKSDSKSQLNHILKEDKKNVQLLIPAYNAAAQSIQIKEVTSARQLRCPGDGYMSNIYRADQWLNRLGMRPYGLDPTKP